MNAAGILFVIMLLLIVTAVLAWAYRDMRNFELKRDKIANRVWLCKACGYTGKVQKKRPGHIFIEIVLWCCYFVPGLIYTIWRNTSQYDVCPECAQKLMIPADSKVAKTILGVQ